MSSSTAREHPPVIRSLQAGARYRYRLDGDAAVPDPYSRFQPEGVHGASEVIDPARFRWTDGAWPGLPAEGLVLYELHVGTMTPEGTFDALIRQLPALKRLGVTAIELMPVAECPGRWNWGYDGVDLFAPSHTYGRPDDLKRLVNAAHRAGLGVLLDVVYNHLGPDGNYLRMFSDDYFTDRHTTLWGDALNYDGPNNRFVRDYVIDNACYWLAEYLVDGLRLDATAAIIDESPTHLLAELSDRARAAAGRPVVLFAEEARNDVRTIRRRDQGGFGITGVWADDFHHAMRVFLTGEREGYYTSYQGTLPEIATALEQGFIFQGQPSARDGTPRGTAVTDEPATAFVFCIQNHDQIDNRAYGERLHHDIDVERYHAASALLLLAPETPLLFMGQEFRASASFMFFTDHQPELGRLVTEGRREEFKGFRAFADPHLRAAIPDPQAEETFIRSKLDLGERRVNASTLRLYRDLLALRHADPVLKVGPDMQPSGRCRGRDPGAAPLARRRSSPGGRQLRPVGRHPHRRSAGTRRSLPGPAETPPFHRASSLRRRRTASRAPRRGHRPPDRGASPVCGALRVAGIAWHSRDNPRALSNGYV